MAENVVAQGGGDNAVAQTEFQNELHQQMQNSGVVPRETTPASPAPAAEPPAQPAAAQPDQPAQPLADVFTPFREKFGYQTPEDAIKEIEAYRQLQAKPYTEVEFTNEESKAIMLALSEGKYDDVRNFLNSQDRLQSLAGTEVNEASAADIVKYGLQLKHKDLKPQEIDWLYNKKYSVPPKPVRGADEDEMDFAPRLEEWQRIATDKQMELMIEAKMMRPELEAAKKNLVFPKIQQPVDDGYAQYQQMLASQEKLDAETKAAYKAFTSNQFGTSLDFNDEANKVSFKFQFEPDAEMFNQAIGVVSDWDSFMKHFTNSDGTPNRQKFLQGMLFALNPEKYLTQAMNQAKNATIKAQLPDNSSEGGLLRQIVPNTPMQEDELTAAMRMAGISRAANQ